MNEPNPLNHLSESIADGDAIDWDAVCALAADDDIRQLVEHLRVVAGVAEVHRTQIAETIATTAAGPPAVVVPAAAAPKRWGHLLLVRKIGEGAFGEVYEALDTWLDHPRALKLLKHEVANRSSAPQILHEARKLVRVRHPNVVMVHGADSHDGRVGFWMDLIEGQTLEQRVREGRLSAGEASYIGQELCRALAAVHHANLVHRDVKAQNVMRASDGGRIILMDFGAGEFRNTSSPGRPHGTPLYLAPEVIIGGAATVQSDIYALGVLLYYLVTGRFPVEGASLTDLAIAHAQRARRHLRDARPDLPDGFVSVVERALDSDPARRFQSAGDFHVALEERDATRPALAPNPLLQTPLPPPPDTQLSSLLRALVVGAAGLLSIFVLGMIATRTFEVVINVRPEFFAGPGDYLVVGYQALLPFVLQWLAFIALLVLLSGVFSLLRSRVARLLLPAREFFGRMSPVTLATLIPVIGTLLWVVEASRRWTIVDSLIAIHFGQPLTPAKIPILDEAFAAHQYGYSQFATFLSFAVLFAAWRWWPSFEHRAAPADLGAVRRMKYASFALVALVVITAVAPRRFAMERFPVVVYKNHQSYVIATRGADLLLYVGDSIDTVRPIVRWGDPDVQDAQKLRNLTGLPRDGGG